MTIIPIFYTAMACHVCSTVFLHYMKYLHVMFIVFWIASDLHYLILCRSITYQILGHINWQSKYVHCQTSQKKLDLQLVKKGFYFKSSVSVGLVNSSQYSKFRTSHFTQARQNVHLVFTHYDQKGKQFLLKHSVI